MLARKHIEMAITLILHFGTLISVLLVSTGGFWYLLQHGNTLMIATTLTTTQIQLSLSPFGIIELGLIVLVVTQILRIALLIAFYAWLRDYWFTAFSAFILLTLILAPGVI